MAVFGWFGAGVEPPRQWDLRRCGWRLVPVSGSVVLVEGTRRADGIDPARCLYLGIDSSRERSALLAAGAGDVAPGTIGLAELAERAGRVIAARSKVPRRRDLGPLTLDLLHRDAMVPSGWLALHPREFELLWRLAERPGERVSRERLLRDVWRLEFEPGTNSVEVHVSRLRAKLAAAGITGLVATDAAGGYRLACGQDEASARFDQRLFASGIS